MGHILRKYKKKSLIWIGVLCNVGILGYFKYGDFLIQNINQVFHQNIRLYQVLLPLGISFFTFQQLSYLIDCYREDVPKYHFVEYALFVCFFPQLVAGPIVSHGEIIPQFSREVSKQQQAEDFGKGLMLFAMGLSKKVLLADIFGRAVDYGYANYLQLNSSEMLLIMLSYTLQIYFDFSGYCDMAMGIARMFHIHLPLNFISPYKSRSIREFWSRWHITLTRFLTKYIYFPLGGSRKGTLRTYINIMIVFLISGIWHGAAWTFVLWGVLHGLFMVITRFVSVGIGRFSSNKKMGRSTAYANMMARMTSVLGWLLTFCFVNITWIYFRADSIGMANKMLATLFQGSFGAIRSELANIYLGDLIGLIMKRQGLMYLNPGVIAAAGVTGLSCILILCFKNAYQKTKGAKPNLGSAFVTVVLLTISILSLGGESAFLYFNF
jgi:D-alanyl-lipoteichoic acid acyltransferase DltB (MBOAT superfamily)